MILVLAPTATVPFERDEGEYAWAADLLARGQLPYRDTFLQKPPGVVLAYRLVHAAVGRGPIPVHLALLAVYAAAAVATAALARRLGGERAGLAAALAFALPLSFPMYQGSAFNTEALVVLGTALAGLGLQRLYVERTGGWAALAAGGAATACLGKQVAAPFAVFVFVTVVALGRTARERLVWGSAAAGLIVAPYLTAVAYFAARGALPEFLDGVLLHNLEYTGESLERSYLAKIGVPGIPLSKIGLGLAALALGMLASLVLRRAWWPVLLLGAWLATGWVGVSAGGHYRGHYFLQLVPPVAVLAGMALAALPRVPAAVAAVVLIAVWADAGGITYGKSALRLHQNLYRSNMFVNAVDIAGWVRNEMDRRGERTLYVSGSEPEILHLTDAEPVTRYVIQNPLFGGYPSSRRRQEEVWRALAARPPAFLITVHPQLAVPAYPGADVWLFERLDSLIAARYRPAVVSWHDRAGVFPATRGAMTAQSRTVADVFALQMVVHVRR